MQRSPSAGSLAQLACVLEVTARKPGNVHRGRDFEDAGYLDFVLSASAISGPLDRASEIGVGRAVEEAIAATRKLVATNTNLGMVLLLAPLAAIPQEDADARDGVARVLDALTVEDARAVYRAIRLAEPGGLGSAPEQDVANEPTLPLRDVMRLAADRDAVARQYANGYADVIDVGLTALRSALASGQTLETAIVSAHLALMAARPDTLIARKRGASVAAESARRAQAVLDSGWPEAAHSAAALTELDAWLRADGHARNPGASADLVTAALYLTLREGTIRLPISPDHWRMSER